MKILFICTYNSARSQMAEGLMRELKGKEYESYSAGVRTSRVDPFAVEVMKEIDIDISSHRAKSIDEFRDTEFDYVVTVCGHANEHCPVFPGKTHVVHVGFDDPPRLAKKAKTEKEALDCYRRVRDEIKAFVEKLPDVLNERRQ